MLLDHARTLSYAEFARVIAVWRQLAEPDDVEDDAAAGEAANRVHLSQTLGNRYALDGDLDPIGGAEVAASLQRIEDELFERDWAELRAEVGDAATVSMLRSPSQRRAEALIVMARRAHAAPPGARAPAPLITVLVDYPTLVGRVLELYNNGTAITPGQLAGRVLEVSERRRFFRGALRRALQIRFRTCVHDGCDVRSDRCEIDHTTPACEGGPTVQANGRPLCAHHHPRPGHRRRSGPPG
jgi:hypothetical protein